MNARGVDFVCYNVSNLQNAIAFYRDTLGLRLECVFEDAWAELSAGSTTLALCGPPWAQPPEPGYKGGATVALAVEDVKAAADELKSMGIAILEEASDTPVCSMAMIADPDGNRLWLHSRKDGTFG